jgi:hypothetical protein
MLWLIKNKAKVYYCSLLCIDLVHIYYGSPPNYGVKRQGNLLTEILLSHIFNVKIIQDVVWMRSVHQPYGPIIMLP